jgi:hypothetical protein
LVDVGTHVLLPSLAFGGVDGYRARWFSVGN